MTNHKSCNQCSASVINGVFCHEQGCPNQHKTWDNEREAWISYYPCYICGYDVEEGESCSCNDDNDDEMKTKIIDMVINQGNGEVSVNLIKPNRTNKWGESVNHVYGHITDSSFVRLCKIISRHALRSRETDFRPYNNVIAQTFDLD